MPIVLYSHFTHSFSFLVYSSSILAHRLSTGLQTAVLSFLLLILDSGASRHSFLDSKTRFLWSHCMYSSSGTGLDTLNVSLPRFPWIRIPHSLFCCLEVLLDASFRFSLRDAPHMTPSFSISCYVRTYVTSTLSLLTVLAHSGYRSRTS